MICRTLIDLLLFCSFQLLLHTLIYTMSWTSLLVLCQSPLPPRLMKRSWNSTKVIMLTPGINGWKRSVWSRKEPSCLSESSSCSCLFLFWLSLCLQAVTDAVGLPVAVQCVALAWQEELCLRFMKEVETLTRNNRLKAWSVAQANGFSSDWTAWCRKMENNKQFSIAQSGLEHVSNSL